MPRTSRFARAGRDTVAAAVVSLAAVSFYISAASLMFQGALGVDLPAAIGATLLGGGVLSLIGSRRSALPLAAVGSEPATVPVLAAITAGVTGSMSGPALMPTALLALMVTGLAIGATWWLLGRRGWGDLIRYIPYPVIGGFLASVGWLMLTGGLGVSMGQAFSLPQAAAWLGGAADGRLAAGLVIGVVLWRATLRFSHPLTLPGLLLLGAVLIHAGLAFAGHDLAAARAGGWLLAAFSRTVPAMPWSPELLGLVRWDVIAEQLPLMVSAVIVATMSLLLSDTSLEVAWEERADINHDLRALGQANLVAVGLGGMVGGISISRSMLNRAAGAVGRTSGFITGLLCLLVMVGGGPIIALVPRPLLGGMLVYLGLGMLKTWLVDTRHRLPGRDYLTLVVMVAVTALAGFLPAVSVGVLACCVDFAVSSARLAPVRRLISRAAWPARAERGAADATLLRREGERMRIAELQGVLFFGSATQLARQLEPLLDDDARPECLLFDFRHVRGLDTSAAQTLARLFKRAAQRGVRIELSQLAPEHGHALAAAGMAPSLRRHADVDAAVAAWDDAVLDRSGPTLGLEAVLAGLLPPEVTAGELLAPFEPLVLADGEPLFARGDDSEALYLVRSGRVAVLGEDGGGGEVLLRTVHAGSTLGEMGLFRRTPRSASARAQGRVELLRLSRERFETVSREQPHLAAALYRLVVMQMAGRVEQLGTQAQALAR